MRRLTAALAMVAAATAAGPSFAQESDGSVFGSVVGGLVGGAIGAAVSGHRPRAADFVPGEAGGRGKATGGGEHRGAPGAAAAGHQAAHAGGGGGAPAHRKQGK